jgi:hypothetical protein
VRENGRGERAAERRKSQSAIFRATVTIGVLALAAGGYLGFTAMVRTTAASSASSSVCMNPYRVGTASPTAETTSPSPLPSGVEPITAPAHSKTTSANPDELWIDSAQGDSIGRGRSADYTGKNTFFSGTVYNILASAGPWRLEIDSGNAARFLCGTFTGATENRPADTPYISMSGDGAGCNTTTGSFTIYEIAFDARGEITRLNMTFDQTCDASTGPMVGLVRFNATTPTPVPDLPASAEPSNVLTPSPVPTSTFSGFTSANADEFEFRSDPNSSVGLGRSADSTGREVTVSGSANAAQIVAGGWTMELDAAHESRFAEGTYQTGPIATASQASISVFGGGRDCPAPYGTLTIYQLATDSSGRITRLNATFSESCDSRNGPPLVGYIRFNATEPTPIPVLIPSSTDAGDAGESSGAGDA